MLSLKKSWVQRPCFSCSGELQRDNQNGVWDGHLVQGHLRRLRLQMALSDQALTLSIRGWVSWSRPILSQTSPALEDTGSKPPAPGVSFGSGSRSVITHTYCDCSSSFYTRILGKGPLLEPETKIWWKLWGLADVETKYRKAASQTSFFSRIHFLWRSLVHVASQRRTSTLAQMSCWHWKTLNLPRPSDSCILVALFL